MDRQKLRRAAALALVTWYLLMPPTAKSKRPDLKAPLAAWTHERRFDNSTECETYRDRLIKTLDLTHQNVLSMHAFRIVNSKCIAADDPRLIAN